MNKDVLRKGILSDRLSYDLESLRQKSDIICSKFCELFGLYDSFLLYNPIKSEVDTKGLVDELYSRGKSVYLPSVSGHDLVFRKFEGWSAICKGAFCIDEARGEKFEKEDKCVAAVPGVAFDENFGRLGFGKGFYDKFLVLHKNIVKVGFAYGFQIVKTVYPEAHDVAMDFVISEEGVIRNEKSPIIRGGLK